MLSTLFTLGIYVTGVFASDIREFGDLTRSPSLKGVTRVSIIWCRIFTTSTPLPRGTRRIHSAVALIAQNTLYAVLYVALGAARRLGRVFEAQSEVRCRAQTRPLWTAAIVRSAPFSGHCGAAGAHRRADALAGAAREEELLLRSGAAKKLSLGYDSLLADIYWTRAVQYYGARVGTPGATFDLLWPLLDVTTTLDPHLMPLIALARFFSPRRAKRERTDRPRHRTGQTRYRRESRANGTCRPIWVFSTTGG